MSRDSASHRSVETNPPCITAAIVVPTFNNAGTLADVLDALCPKRLPIIVVDDGSTDGTPDLLAHWRASRPEVSLHVERHARNRGKAQALRTGFAMATGLGATHAVTIDSDGQHDPADVAILLEAARVEPRALILGVRSTRISGYPRRCRVGRRVASALVRIETLVRLRDTQCGLRIYPLGLVRSLRCQASRFSYETEIIVRAAWAGCRIVEAPVSCVYDVPNGRVSHWRPFMDTCRDGLLHARLLARSLMPAPHPRWPDDADEYALARRCVGRAILWLSPQVLWRKVRDTTGQDSGMAASLALGAFVACSPFYGLHGCLALYLAWRLRLHPLPALVGSMLSTPPLGLVIVGASIQVGHLLLTGRFLAWPVGDEGASLLKMSGRAMAYWLLGSVVVGALVSSAVFAVARQGERRVSRPAEGVGLNHEAA